MELDEVWELGTGMLINRSGARKIPVADAFSGNILYIDISTLGKKVIVGILLILDFIKLYFFEFHNLSECNSKILSAFHIYQNDKIISTDEIKQFA